jgi:DNA-binding SARP family transcriptional activator/TolB-like protein
MDEYAQIGGDGAKPSARLVLFGKAPAIEVGGSFVRVPRLGLILAAFLQLDCPSTGFSRESAAEFLWEDLDKDRRAGNLRQLLLRLRILQSSLKLRLFEIRDDHVALDPDGGHTDVQAFRALTPPHAASDIAALCEIYQGELLADLNERGEKLSLWLASKRDLLRKEFVAAILPFVERQEYHANPDLVILAGKRLIQADPFHEAGHRALMRAYFERGDAAAARRRYEKMEQLFTAELGCRPSLSTRELYQTLSVAAQRPPPIAHHPFPREAEKPAELRRSIGFAVPGGLPRLAILAPSGARAPHAAREMIDRFLNDLATRLSQTRSFVVAMPELAMIGANFSAASDIDYLVEVGMRQGAKDPAIYVRLLATSTREILWASDFEGVEIFSDAVSTIVYSVLVHVENRELQFLQAGIEQKSAYRLAVQGQRNLQTVDLPSIRRARALFKASLAAASTHTPALAGLSRSYVLEWLVRMNPERSLLEAAEQCARKILSHCSDDYRGFRELGLVQMYQRKYEQSIDNLGHSMRLNPTDLDVQVDLADAMTLNGNAAEAVRMFAESKLLRRRGSDYDHWILAGAYYHCANYRAALDEIACMQNPAPALKLSAAAHAMLGEQAPARRRKAELIEFNPGFNLTQWLSNVPCRDQRYVGHYSDGLRRAGFA